MKTMVKRFLGRAILGVVAIVVVNQILAYYGHSLRVGVNIWSCLTSGTLGIPGVTLLYGIMLL